MDLSECPKGPLFQADPPSTPSKVEAAYRVVPPRIREAEDPPRQVLVPLAPGPQEATAGAGGEVLTEDPT